MPAPEEEVTKSEAIDAAAAPPSEVKAEGTDDAAAEQAKPATESPTAKEADGAEEEQKAEQVEPAPEVPASWAASKKRDLAEMTEADEGEVAAAAASKASSKAGSKRLKLLDSAQREAIAAEPVEIKEASKSKAAETEEPADSKIESAVQQ